MVDLKNRWSACLILEWVAVDHFPGAVAYFESGNSDMSAGLGG